MSGPSFQFVAFAVLVALLVNAARSVAWRQGVMVAASILFLGLVGGGGPLAFAPLVGFLLVGFVLLRQARRGRAVAASVVAVLALFVWLKHYAFVPRALWLPGVYTTVGLSYILFRLLHLILEARQEEAPEIGFTDYVAYLIGFNTLIAGPIQYYAEYREELERSTRTRVTIFDVGEAAERIIVGLFKTNVLAALLSAQRADALAALSEGGSGAPALANGALVFALYPLFLYCNFSGYIDLVVGCSRLFGVRLPENFDRPFSATSFIDFWNRWHITLSRWLRAYVYNPLLLASMRRFPARGLESTWAVLAFFVTFFLVGLWHGQTAGFLFFGFLQGGGVAVNKLYQLTMVKRLGRKPFAALGARRGYRALARGLTFTWFTFTLTWFWATWSEALGVFARLSPAQWLAVWVVMWAVATVLLEAWERARAAVLDVRMGGRPVLHTRYARTAWTTALFFVTVAGMAIATQSAPEIVYKTF
jgi:alginate O-acetyltransferase complex protein AlgI